MTHPIKQAVILAGGKGTRLRQRLGDLPKPLIDVVGQPLLARQLLLLKKHAIERVLILVNYQAQQIESFCRQHDNWGLQITCIDDGQPRGTAGAVLQVWDQLDAEFLLLYGDTMLDVDLTRMMNFHQQHISASQVPGVTLMVHPNDHPQDSDLIETDAQGHVIAVHPYPHPAGRYLPNLVNAALYVLHKSVLQTWRERSELPSILDFGKDIFPSLVKSNCLLVAYNSPEYIKDCGTPDRLDKVCADFSSGRIAAASLNVPQRAVFLDRDGTLNIERGYITHPDALDLLPGVAHAVRRLNRAGYRCCIVTNQPVLARGECSVGMLEQIHHKLETLLGYEGAYVDRIAYCPHHPDAGFSGEVPALKMVCNCRKPAIGMVEQLMHDLNIDKRQSWFVGDTTRDMETAQRAQLRGILVATGHGGQDRAFAARGDFAAKDLSSAVDLILASHS